MTRIAISAIPASRAEYVRAVETAGGTALLLDLANLEALEAQLANSAGVLLSGGGDVEPKRYGGPPQLATGVDPARDDFEFTLVRRARELALPTLCICRGLQVANVAFGGTLVGDISTSYDVQTAERHRSGAGGKSQRGLIAGHEVTITARSLLATIVGTAPIVTSSRHHQSLATVAADLTVVGTTSDGIIEAVEARFASPFWLGVQWHPESTLDDAGPSRAIFAAFVAAAQDM